jgi:hypothetical protein
MAIGNLTLSGLMPVLISSVVTIGALIATLVVQRMRFDQERRQREKETTERLLREKAELLYLTSLKLFDALGSPVVVSESPRIVFSLASVIGSADDNTNLLKMLIAYHFPFLASSEGAPNKVFSSVTKALKGFLSFSQTQSLSIGKIKPNATEDDVWTLPAVVAEFRNLKSEINRNKVLLSGFLLGLTEMDLYRMFQDWKQRGHQMPEE